LPNAGYDVAINFKVDGTGADKIARQLQQQYGVEAISAYADVGKQKEVDDMFAPSSIVWAPGCPGQQCCVQVWKPLLEVQESEWDLVLTPT